MDIMGICGGSNRLLPEANEHPAGYTAKESRTELKTDREREGERDK